MAESYLSLITWLVFLNMKGMSKGTAQLKSGNGNSNEPKSTGKGWSFHFSRLLNLKPKTHVGDGDHVFLTHFTPFF